MPRTVLMAWELGGGTGHVMRLKPVAEALRAKGDTVVFAVRELPNARPLVDSGFEVVLAPRILSGLNTQLQAFNHAELLMRAGFDRPANMLTVVASWRALIETVAADLVVADFAPTALLGAAAAGVAAATVGTGFAVPPPVSPLPSVRHWEKNPVERMARAEHAMLAAVSASLVAHGRPAPINLGAAFNTGCDLACVFSELDHFARPDHARPHYVGPIFSSPRGAKPTWPDAAGDRIFAYLDAAAGPSAMLTRALANSGRPTLLVARGRASADLGRWAGRSLTISHRPVDLAEALSTAALVVCHGGMGLVSQALMAGVPMVIKPLNPEQRGTALRVESLGAALTLPQVLSDEDASAALADAGGQDTRHRSAQVFAARYCDFRVGDAVDQVVAALATTT
ncbi:MAG: glycosyltransferase [Rhodospirillaceae bacterium]|nr:glycosyltransferase [Rhodospirillaceae bacterium]